MSYKITITETRKVKKLVGKDWAVLSTKEVPRDTTFYRGDKNEPKTRIEEVHGYTPEIEKMVEETRFVLEQVVDDMNVTAVIKAINKL